jgi:hypothetical protein
VYANHINKGTLAKGINIKRARIPGRPALVKILHQARTVVTMTPANRRNKTNRISSSGTPIFPPNNIAPPFLRAGS